MIALAALTPRRLRQLWYMPLLVLAMGLMMARTLVMARLLDVPGFAQFSAGQLVSSTFSMLGCLGLQPLLQREMPVQIVRRRERAAAVLTMQCLLVAAACALVGLLLAAGGLSAAGLGPGLLAVGVLHGLSQQVFLISTVESRSRGEPVFFARQNLERAGLAFAAGCGVALLVGSAGPVLLTEAAVSYLLTWRAMGRVLRPSALGLRRAGAVALHRIRRLPWGSATALLALMFVSFLFLNADRWFAADLLPHSGFAVYAFAWVLLSVAQSVQIVINASFYPLLARRYASHGRRAAFRFCAIASIGLLAVCVVGLWPVDWLLGAIVGRWFPAYDAARAIFAIFLVVAALRVSDFWSSYLVIVGVERRLLAVYVVVGVVVCGAWVLAVRPWAGGTFGVVEVAWLACGLTVAGYASALATAWLNRRDR
ncbi:MAG: hypothetical protein OJF60_000838 [Burkholderiaceae bacterium]|nr:MAG: hypothetical protein OJF60_000838 [Burkholderiaceae bacterium]